MLADISRDPRALGSAPVRNLHRWPVLGFTPLDPRSYDAAQLRVRSGWRTADLPRIGRL